MFGLTTKAALRQAEADVATLGLEVERLNNAVFAADRRADDEKARARTLGRLNSELLTERDAARGILREIDAMETPACASIGRRMAAKAREGLPEFAAVEPVREVA